LARFPGTKWVVHNGWYTYGNTQYMGWYFQSIPANTIIPACDSDLRLCTIVSTESDCGCNCQSPCPAPCPPSTPVNPSPPSCIPNPGTSSGDGVEFTHGMAHALDRAFLSVNTISQRDQLNIKLLPHGKLVRVNDTGDGTHYYAWNQITQTWDEESFGFDASKYVNHAQLSEEVKIQLSSETKEIHEDISDLRNDIHEVQSFVNWEPIKSEI